VTAAAENTLKTKKSQGELRQPKIKRKKRGKKRLAVVWRAKGGGLMREKQERKEKREIREIKNKTSRHAEAKRGVGLKRNLR